MSLEKLDPDDEISFRDGARHYISFQVKLLADAARDLLLAPISMIALIIDWITGPPVKESLSFKLMLLGRKSDRVINLFGEFTEEPGYTLDETVRDVESALMEQIAKKNDSKSES